MSETRNARLIVKRTSVAGKIPTGTTGDESSFIRQGELALNTTDRKLWSYDGTNVFEIGSYSYLGLSGGTITGNTQIIGNISATTIYSGSTDLSDIFLTTADGNDITRVQNGLNTYTGGTGNLPTVNISGGTLDNINVSGISIFNSITAITISGGIIYSGGTNLSDIFATSVSGDVTRVQNGLNTYTGGSVHYPTINVSGLTIDNINVSGGSVFESLSANSLSASSYYSGSTPLGEVFTPKTVLRKEFLNILGEVAGKSGFADFGFLNDNVAVLLYDKNNEERALYSTIITDKINLNFNPNLIFTTFSIDTPVSGVSDTVYLELECRYIQPGESSSKTADETITSAFTLTYYTANTKQENITFILDASKIQDGDLASFVLKRKPTNPVDNYASDFGATTLWWTYYENN